MATIKQPFVKIFLCGALFCLLLLVHAPAAGESAPSTGTGDLIFINGFGGCPTVYPDADGDFYGVASGAIISCTPPAGYATRSDDCDDSDAAVHPGATDVPDGAYRDENCDGIDGNIARAAFVAMTGANTGDCGIAAPCASIAFALAALAADPARDHLYVAVGTYAAPLELVAGTSVFGGFDNAWLRSARSQPGHVVIIDGPVHAQGIIGGDEAVLENLIVASPDATNPGTSSYGIVLEGSSGITLARITIDVGAGAAGISMPTAEPGVDAGDGGNGNPGCENSVAFCSSCGVPPGGSRGASSSGHLGGFGGAPGLGSQGGASGGSGVQGTPGGPGASCSGCDGQTGISGSVGSPGVSGDGGAAYGGFSGNDYLPSAGTGGEAGSPGQGGGGGGGGGGSFGVVLVNAQVVLVDSVDITSSGGNGGVGSNGGGGGRGGDPGVGGPYGGGDEQDDGGFGAPGGSGGVGGEGGHGGGGGGGPSIAVVCLGTSDFSQSGTTLTPGTGGPGGTSNGNPGASGLSAPTHGCSP